MAERLQHSYPEGPYTREQKTQDLVEHEQTYKGFLWLSKWGTIAVAIILVLLYIFLV